MSLYASEIETDAVSSSKELIASEVPRKVHQILSQDVVDVFPATHDPPEEALVQSRLIGPLEGLWGAKEIYKVLQSTPTVANFCGKVFKNGEPAIFCKDCQTDPTCCLCLECFEHSEHKNHNYKMFASGGGGCCDCGDPEAWIDHTYCTIHKPREIVTTQVDPVSNLEPPLVDCAQSFLSTVLWYCMLVLNWEESRSVPPDVDSTKTQTLLMKDEFMAFLLNDEVHSYDDVITGLNKHLGMSPTDATDLATTVDRRGRGILKDGSEQECLTAQTNINKSLRHSPLGVKVFHKVLVKHQNCALYFLNFLKDLAEKSEGFCRLIAMVLVRPSLTSNNQCILDRYFLTDNSLWIEARLCWSRLIMSSIYKDFEYKKQLAISLARNYQRLAKNFMEDSHDHDVCAMNLTVQLFTVPSLSRMLVADHNVLENVVLTIGDIVSPLFDGNKECLNLHSKQYKHERIAYLLYDLRYVLRNRPEDWTDQLRARTRDGGRIFINLLSSMENMDSVRRQTGSHVEQEPHWENSFNFSIILMQAIKLFIDWCTSDQKILQEIIIIALERLMDMTSRFVFKSHSVDINVTRRRSFELISFDIFKDRASFHHPLARLIAGLLANGASRYNKSITDMLRISSTEQKTPLLLMEPCSRSIVLSSQVLGGMWKRNGYGILNQALHYQLHLSRGIMYDKDVIMLQSMATVLDPDVFLYALIYKYRLEHWFTSPSNGTKEWRERGEDAVRFLLAEIEEFMFLLIVIFGERFQLGIGEGITTLDPIRRELIHLLYIAPLPHSQIMKKFKMTENDTSVNKLIKEVAVLKRISGKSVFELKEEHMESYDPFYYHYSKMEQSKAEESWRKRQKSIERSSRPSPMPPCLPPSFTRPYQGIMRLVHSSVLMKIIYNVFSEAVKDSSRLWSARLLHQTLHLSALIIAEEHRAEENTFAKQCLSPPSNDRNAVPLLSLLETLQATSKVEERKGLLVWVIQQLQEVRQETTGHMSIPPVATPTTEETEDTDSPTPTKKRLLAEEQRKRMMKQIAEMQKKFFEEHKNELELIENTSKPERQGSVASQTGSALLCAVGMSAVRSHEQSTATCILCQDTGDVGTSDEKAFVLGVSVQRSSVMRRSEKNISGDLDFLNGRMDNKWSIFTGGCGHIMHADCWKKYVNDKQIEQRRRFFFPLHGHTIHWQDGEFLCPLCQTFGNAVLPLALHPPRGTSYMPSRPLSLKETRSLIGCMVKLGAAVTSESNDFSGEIFDEFTRTVERFFSVSFVTFEPVPSLNQSAVTALRSSMEYVFTQQCLMQGYAELPDSNSKKMPAAMWNNCLHTIVGLEHSLRQDGKFLLDSLSSRQMDIVYSLMEFTGLACDSVDTATLSEYANNLIIDFLPKCSAFSERPSVLEMDVFSIAGNLRIILSALIQRLTVTKGASFKGGNNLYYPAMIGLIDTCIVSVATSALIVQYLLCTLPGMETDSQPSQSECEKGMEVDGEDSSPELAEGIQLQKLWITLREYALNQSVSSSTSLSAGDTPPNPYSLYVGMQEYLYPFLQCLALFYHSVTGIKFIHSSASVASNFSDLCTFLGLPQSLPSLLDDSFLQEIAKNWCSHRRVVNIVKGVDSSGDLLILQPTRRLIPLPNSYSDLVSKASHFKCPRSAELGGDDTQASMLCLLCGEMICSNSYCCRKSVDNDERAQVGGLTYHSQKCGSGFGIALWILESYIVLLNATDVHRVRGCTLTPPYIDEYGEPDPGLRRGNPLHLNPENYKTIQSYWLNHQLPEQICKEMEQNMRLLQINWALM